MRKGLKVGIRIRLRDRSLRGSIILADGPKVMREFSHKHIDLIL